ncbi:MAG TPA: hypothetical protein HA230_02800 [Candidatus Aenigmarchaeota archaeon]|nr:hypothetical protein [Candidatus Aenigmarchaeota archaeon]
MALQWIFKNKLLVILFALSTAFFVYQHFVNFSWDFATYEDNARYWAGQGSYYEPGRPPLVPLMLMGGEYLFIVLSSLLFLYATIKLADAMKLRREVFYLLLLSPFVLFFGLINGTELLSLALLELFLALMGKRYSGTFLGIACLARYNFVIFAPLLLADKNPKKIALNIMFFVLPFLPWFLYNFYTTGNAFTSMVDSYAINVKFRYYFTQPFSVMHLVTAITFLLPVFAYGLFIVAKRWKRLTKEKYNILMLAIMILSIYLYSSTFSKELRYLFPLALPVAYFSYRGFDSLRKKPKTFLLTIIIALNLVLFVTMNISANYESKDKYADAINVLRANSIENCSLMTNAWSLINYLGMPAEPFPRKELVQHSIDEGNFILFFYSIGEPDWAQNRTFMEQYKTVYESKEFIILGNASRCMPQEKVNQTYLSMLHDKIFLVYNVSINTNPCFVMFSGNSFLESSCNFVNMKGFVTDENRITGLEMVRD